MWLLIDNYDSFTYILHHYLLETGNECKVIRNDEWTIEEIKAFSPSRIILSPGPETPHQAGITLDVIHEFHNRLPILGICLGHQALGMYFGAELILADYPMHGKTSNLIIDSHPIFQGIPNRTTVMRYHSLILKTPLVNPLKSIATSAEDQYCMAIAHDNLPLIGLQFHPESICTAAGKRMIGNWAGLY